MISNDKPIFSIIIPTYGRPKQLRECLDSITGLDYPKDNFEVIVIDDGSKTSLGDIVGAFQKKINVKLFRQDNAGPATARNRGAEESSGKYLAFTDDDCKPSPDWLWRLEDLLNENPGLLVAGRTVNDLTGNPYSMASQLIADFLCSYYNKREARFLTSNNMALSREQFLKVGGFDITFPLAAAEDREFCDRYLYCGYKTLYAPDVIVHHAHPLTFRTFFKQHFNYGLGAQKFHSIRAKRNQGVMRIEPMTFYADLTLYPRKTSIRGRELLSFLIILSQVANASGYFSAKIHSSR